MDSTFATSLPYIGDFGLYTAIVGMAVLLLMPENSGRRIGAKIAIVGLNMVTYECLLVHMI